MKRVGFIYEKIYAIDNLKEAFKRASKDKSFYKEVKEIKKDLDRYILELHEMLKNEEYSLTQNDYIMFEKMDKGKLRNIFKLSFYPHRIVQWAIILQLEEMFVKNFVDCTYASIPNRGIHLAMSKLNHDLKNDKEGTKYCLKMDIRKFYPSINHEINKKQYRRKIKDRKL